MTSIFTFLMFMIFILSVSAGENRPKRGYELRIPDMSEYLHVVFYAQNLYSQFRQNIDYDTAYQILELELAFRFPDRITTDDNLLFLAAVTKFGSGEVLTDWA